MTLPLIKLVTLTIKQLSKPLANGIKNSVKTHSRLSRAIAYPAQGYHKLEQTVRMRLMGWNKKIEVRSMQKLEEVKRRIGGKKKTKMLS
ncbi:optic atrophy 3 protein homolog isoform X2 [Hydractinia symbiolongicarpus]|uniref:optic atrophy 3 protein homolog isoform X2 n=1 Tax=Hydractinia symbiolongicarpus TaxID=13093 RepID=UPI00255154DB|nr:optic atrophy 3 protein homolog isoform X2 [Hydractinia symbiolongicarpus]